MAPLWVYATAAVVSVLAIAGAHRWTYTVRAFWWTAAGIAALWLVAVPAINVWAHS